MIQYVVTAEPVGVARTLYADYSARVQGLSFASNNRGLAECTGFIPMGMDEAFALYAAFGALRVQICDTSSSAIYDGRIEDVALNGKGVTLTALGYARSLSDTPYTALWSATQIGQWEVLTSANITGTMPDKYKIDFNNRIYVGLQKGTIYTNVTDFGIVGFRRAHGSSRGIVGLSFDMILSLPTGWDLVISRRDDSWGAGVAIDTITAGAGVTPINKFYTFTASGSVTFLIYNNSGGNYTHALENGVSFINATNVRVVTATTNMVSTTVTANTAFAVGMTITVGSTARMYAGQRLHIGHAAAGVGCTVTSVTDATHFVTSVDPAFGTAAIGDVVKAFVIYADEIADDLIATVSALNSGQLASSAALTDSPALDLFNESYEDMRPSDILDYLTGTGDASGRVWEWGVRADQRLYFRPQGTNAHTWYIDVSDLDIQRTLDSLTNSVYAVYQEAGGRTLRAAATSDAASIARYGLTRRSALAVSTTSVAQASLQQATALADGKDPKPQSGVVTTQVFDANGQRWPLWYVAAGDTVVIRNLSPSLGSAIDRVRVFRLTRAEYQFDTDTLLLEPETPLPSLDALLARVLPPSWITDPWWMQRDR